VRPGLGVIDWLVSTWLTVTQTVSATLANIIVVAMALVSLWTFWPLLNKIDMYLWIPAAGGLLLGVLGWLIFGLLYGALIGSVFWALTQTGATIWGIRRRVAETQLPVDPELDNAPAQPPAIRTTPSEILSGPCIANQDVSIEDLIRDGFVRDSKIESVEFRNCTICGPGVITVEAPRPLSLYATVA